MTPRLHYGFALAAFVLPLFAAALIGRLAPPPSIARAPVLALESIAVEDTDALKRLFNELGYGWPPVSTAGAVPPIAVRSMPADIDTLTVNERKRLFFRIVAPLIAAENRQLRERRAFLQETFATYPVLPESGPVAKRVRQIARRFNVAGHLDKPENRALLLRRVDIIPAPLALAQAANESGWGRSRFAREANNLFGMWTWDESRGMRPQESAADADHFVRMFNDLQASVSNYLHTINVGPAYRDFRELRAQQRLRDEEPDALLLAGGLTRYSARGEEYVEEIRAIIEYNGLHELPPLRIQGSDTAPLKN